VTFEHAGVRYTAGVVRFDDGSIAEVFLSTAKHGTGLETNAHDAAISASLLQQHRCSSETLQPGPARLREMFVSESKRLPDNWPNYGRRR
jgi:hypothetical protein